MNTKHRSLVSVAFAFAFLAGGCRTEPGGSASPLSPDGLSEDAQQTYAAYVRAVNAGTEQLGAEIPRAYWAGGIDALRPLNVYIHRVNIVVVQDHADGIEKGKYIYIPVSSYLPQSGDDGFEFTPNPRTGNTYSLGTGVFDFRRTN